MNNDDRKLLATLEWFTLRELSLRWRTSKETLRRQCESGELPNMRIGSQYRVHQTVVKQIEEAAKVETVARARETAKRVKQFAASGVDHIG